MDLKRLTQEVRPTGGVFAIEDVKEHPVEPVIVYGTGNDAVECFKRLAGHLAYGSAMVLVGVPLKAKGEMDVAEKVAAANEFRFWEPPGQPSGSRVWIKSFYDGDTYGTHRPYLLEAVRRTTGAVLELGAGPSSTPHLHALCAELGRMLVTVDGNEKWVERYGSMKGSAHRVEHCADPAQSSRLDEEWGVVFVDHAPGETRGKAIERARSKAQYLVIHDTEDLGYGIEALLSTFKHRKDFRRARPWTTVVSMTLPIWE